MRARLAAAAAGSAAFLAACGADDGYENALRPPAPIVVTASIDHERVRVSPREFGAGPVTFVISNTSGAPQRVTFETDEIGGDRSGITRSTGEIAARSTGRLQVAPREGTYRLAVPARSIRPAQIEVGAARASAQDRLLQP